MKRFIALALFAFVCTAAAPAQANDARLRFVLGLTLAKTEYIAHRIAPDKPAIAKFGARLARLARREARVLSHVSPSSHAGAVARHTAVKGLKQLRTAGRLFVIAANAHTRRGGARMAFRGMVWLKQGFFSLAAAAVKLEA